MLTEQILEVERKYTPLEPMYKKWVNTTADVAAFLLEQIEKAELMEPKEHIKDPKFLKLLNKRNINKAM